MSRVTEIRAGTGAEHTAAVPLLTVKDLHAYYGQSHVLHGVSFEVRPGEVVTLVGRNGAGKTTTLNCLCGVIRQKSGSIHFGAQDITRLPAHQIARSGLSLVPDDRGIYATLSVLENLTLPHRGGAAWTLDQVYQAFPILQTRGHHGGLKLSGGEQQMLSIARALCMGPKLLLLDEPTEGLAPVIVQQIGAVLRDLKRSGLTIILVEQNLRFATTVADRHYLMAEGRIVDSLDNREVIAREQELLKHLSV